MDCWSNAAIGDDCDVRPGFFLKQRRHDAVASRAKIRKWRNPAALNGGTAQLIWKRMK